MSFSHASQLYDAHPHFAGDLNKKKGNGRFNVTMQVNLLKCNVTDLNRIKTQANYMIYCQWGFWYHGDINQSFRYTKMKRMLYFERYIGNIFQYSNPLQYNARYLVYHFNSQHYVNYVHFVWITSDLKFEPVYNIISCVFVLQNRAWNFSWFFIIFSPHLCYHSIYFGADTFGGHLCLSIY